MDEETKEFRHFVIVEWGGKKPSMTWYDRLHSMGLYRNEFQDELEEQGILARRAKMGRKRLDGEQPKGLVIQEGVYLVRSDTFAQRIMHHAKKLGATNVITGLMTVSDASISQADMNAISNIVASETKRGRRPSGNAGTYSVTCLDEAITLEVEAEHLPMDCPQCGSIRIQVAKGKVPIYSVPRDTVYAGASSDDIFKFWKDSRFETDRFVIPIVRYIKSGLATEHFRLPKTSFIAVKLPEIVAAANLDTPDKLFEDMQVDLRLHMRVLDLLYILSQVDLQQDENLRSASRIEVLSGYWANVQDPKPYIMSPPSDGVDIVDLAIHDNAMTRYL